MGFSPWQWGLIPVPETGSWLMIPNNLAGVTFSLPEIKMCLFYTKRACDGAKSVERWPGGRDGPASVDQGLLGTSKLGEVWRTRLVRRGWWEAGLRSGDPIPRTPLPMSHLLPGPDQVKCGQTGREGLNLRDPHGSRICWVRRGVRYPMFPKAGEETRNCHIITPQKMPRQPNYLDSLEEGKLFGSQTKASKPLCLKRALNLHCSSVFFFSSFVI